MKNMIPFAFFSMILLGSGCFYDVDRSRIPECYSSDECEKGQFCSDAGTCMKVIPSNGTNQTGDGGTCDGSSDACQGVEVRGTAMIASGLEAECYAVGDLYLSLVASCPSMSNQDPVQHASVKVSDVDFTSAGNQKAFALDGVSAGTFYLTGFFDHNANADNADPSPDRNDVLGGADFSGTGASCIKVVVAEQDLTHVDVTLDTVMPF